MQFFLNAPLSAKMEGGNPDNRHNKIQQYTGVYTLIMVIAIRIYMSYLRYLTHLTLSLMESKLDWFCPLLLQFRILAFSKKIKSLNKYIDRIMGQFWPLKKPFRIF